MPRDLWASAHMMMGFSLEQVQVQVQVCAFCGQNIRPHRQIPPHCLPRDLRTGRVDAAGILAVLGSCPRCHQPVASEQVAPLAAKLTAQPARKPPRYRDSAVTRCPPGSAALPWDW